MQKLLRLGFVDAVCSFMPILMWYLLGVLYDGKYSNMFTLTYAFQFVYNMLCNTFVSGSLKYEKKNNLGNHNSSYSGVLSGLILFLVVVFAVILNNKRILNYYKLDYETYRLIYLYGVSNLVFDFLIVGLKTILQYDEEVKKSFRVVILYYCLKVIFILPIRVLTKNINLFMISHLVLLAITIVFIYARYAKVNSNFRFSLKLFESIKYSLQTIPSNIGMLVIYSLGISKVTTDSAIYLASYNATAMSTDVQWDILYSAIDTNTSVEVCKGGYDKNRKHLFKQAVTFSIFLMFSIIGLMLIMYKTISNLDLKVMFIIFLLECLLFPIYGIRYVMTSWMGIETPCKEIFIIASLNYIIRVIVSFVVCSKYALSIGVLFSAILGNSAYILLYYIKRKNIKTEVSKCQK